VFTENSTISQVFVDDVFECHILEDKDRELELHPEAKVYGKTAIPRGIYQLVITKSKRFGIPLIEILNVPGYSGVRMHAGNDEHDTDGCMLPGVYTEGVDDWVSFSRATLAKLQNQVQEALNRDEEVTFEVT
jgi:hypothetical protein